MNIWIALALGASGGALTFLLLVVLYAPTTRWEPAAHFKNDDFYNLHLKNYVLSLKAYALMEANARTQERIAVALENIAHERKEKEPAQ